MRDFVKSLKKGKTYTFPAMFLASLSKTTDEILSHDTGPNGFTVLNVLYCRIGRKADERSESSLTETERRLLATCRLECG